MLNTRTNCETYLITEYFKDYPQKFISELAKYGEDDISEILEDLPLETISNIIFRLPLRLAGESLVRLPDLKFKRIYSLLDPVRSSRILLEVSSDHLEKKIALLSPSERKDLKELESYPDDTAGALMDISLEICRSTDFVVDVINKLRTNKANSREIFVTDSENMLVGYLPVQDLLYANDESEIEKIMHKSPPSVNVLSPKDEVIEVFETFKTTMLPVTHIDGTLLGGIKYTSLIEEVQNQALSSMASLRGASPSEKALSPPLFSVGKRLPWLLINLLTAFIASAVVGFFENTISQVTALAILLPVVAGQSGNTGAQAMAVTMRGLALREVRVRQWVIILFKELRVGFVNGVIIAVVTGLAVYFWSNSLPLGAVMTVAMTCSMIIASISGAAIPVILTSLGKDPAQSSSVILTTVTDVMGFLSFLGLATLFISLLTNAA
jgi:magnesium transporter